MIACENSGHSVLDDFAEVSKIVDAGATSKPVKDYELSRYACYLIVQNGDPRKEVIKGAETATSIHYNVGKEVRTAIKKIGGTMPEDLPTPEKSIQQIEQEQMARPKAKAKKGKILLDE